MFAYDALHCRASALKIDFIVSLKRAILRPLRLRPIALVAAVYYITLPALIKLVVRRSNRRLIY
ncbi:hypothetical protein FACS1894216_17490 [Synergistales bacterium]|nr:hypothetical protein FACS1894216_17490 [Synergistales bacterium]